MKKKVKKISRGVLIVEMNVKKGMAGGNTISNKNYGSDKK